MKEKGLLVVVSGFSGAGKGTLIKKLLAAHNCYSLSVSATTRAPRNGEVDGREYHFLTKERFEEMICNDELLEYAQYVQNYYGTPRSFVEAEMQKGQNVLLEIEIQGAAKIREKFPAAVLIFVAPPSAGELEKRLTGRGTESAETIRKRLNRAVEESAWMKEYDYLLINDDLDAAAEKLHNLITSQQLKMTNNLDTVEEICKDLAVHFS